MFSIRDSRCAVFEVGLDDIVFTFHGFIPRFLSAQILLRFFEVSSWRQSF